MIVQTAAMESTVDFGYPWWLNYGHLVVALCALALVALAYRRKWSKWIVVPLALITVWAGISFVIVRFALNVNGKGSLPTQSFLQSGEGRVLDIGAGTGRSTIMVLEARPKANVVALDLFGDSFQQHFGHSETPQQLLLSNLKAAHVDQRATISAADMRQIPFPDASFDAAISCYAIDHLNRDGIPKALSEAARVIKPGGDFLFMVIAKEPWIQFAFGPLLAHGPATRDKSWWSTRITDAGFEIREADTRPAMLYILSQRKSGTIRVYQR
jgi:ubiquinone/menaquinone biosynthesis C-methylase UbiE